MLINTLSIIIIGLCIHCSHSTYVELDDNFSELRKDGGNWLVKFYAPWCGHCQKLEPVWMEVGYALSQSNIRVGRIDCSHFPNIASEFGIRGYPTIKYISHDSEYTFNGDRNKDDIIQFVSRVSGPPVRMISSSEDLSDLKTPNGLFFMFVGDLKGDLWDVFYGVSKRYRPHASFYAVGENVVKEVDKVTDVPAVYLYKEDNTELFRVPGSNDHISLNASLSKWVNKKRFNTFQKVTHGNFQELAQLGQYIVLVVVNEHKLDDISALNFKNMVEHFAKSNKKKYEGKFVFAWTGNPEFANSLALKVVPLPFLMVLNSTNHQYHVPEIDYSQMTPSYLQLFLEKVYGQSVPGYGGSTVGVRVYRAFFEAKTAVTDMWKGNPVVTTVLFVIPLLFLTFIFYTLCFIDIMEPEEEEEMEEREYEESHAKKE